ncbi:MAG: chemotaxis protein CheB [Hyphomonadaceae bacterium]
MAKNNGKKHKTKTGAKPPGSGAPLVSTVAIGSSAGGVGALQTLFQHMPTNLGVAFVVVAHLEPTYRSELVPILQRRTSMAVYQVNAKTPLKPNCVYVIPPDRRLVISDGDISSLPFEEPRGQRAPIDLFFRSLAEQHGDGFAIVLTGAGADGVVGIKAIKEAGGVILVQDPKDAEYGSMPRSAIATGVADVVAPLAELPAKLAELVGHKNRIQAQQFGDDEDSSLRRILTFLRARTGHDFSQYKRPTIMRRISRRMQLNRLDRMEDYAAFLRENAEEIPALFSDLLISVTTFFRDSAAFESLAERVIPQFFDETRDGEPIRIWVTGCATGEEAYSIAILLLEEAARREFRPEIQIFATDLDNGALAAAREGRYPTAIEADVSEERLRRFFSREGDHYRVRKEIRDIVVFAMHSMLKDPPFSRLDLVSCRNLLIYLERELQNQLLSTLRYALKSDCYLFLGSAETADSAQGLFRAIDREHRIYQAAPQGERNVPMLPRMSLAPIVDVTALRAGPPIAGPQVPAATHREALEAAAPPSILVDEEHRILHLSETAGRFLAPSAGPLSTAVTQLARPELRLDIRSGLHRALERSEVSLSLPIPVQFNGAAHRVFVQVRPAPPSTDNRPRALVLFFEGGLADAIVNQDLAGEQNSALLAQMQEELQLTRDRLRASPEEYEAANEELRAANEELQSINEEYRSTAEELETSKEELQSMNEELQTLNSELKMKLEGVSRAHSDLQNLMAATEVGTLFLDTGLRIKRFTPSIADLFNVTPGDEGRPITDFTHRLRYAELEGDSRAVLKNLTPVEREVESVEGRWFLTRIRPYRTVDDRIDGVVATFVDVTERKASEHRLRLLTAELDHRVKNVLARVLALTQISQAATDDSEEAIQTLVQRIRSMAKTHSLLSQTLWSGARLDELCSIELEPYRTRGNISVHGPAVMLNPDAAQAITMVVHELTTNAAKYGALSAAKGRVEIEIATRRDGDNEMLVLNWRESGGPPVKPPEKTGYGTSVIRGSLTHELQAKVDLRFKETGVECEIVAPMAAVKARAMPANGGEAKA